jgi:hypothetical protein
MNSSVFCLLMFSSHYITLAFLKTHGGEFYDVEKIDFVVAYGGGVRSGCLMCFQVLE